MKRTKDLNTNKGITLIALVITIIVMLILVAVTISMAINGGLFEQAGKAASGTNEALKEEEELSKGKIQVGEEVYNSIDEYLNKIKEDNVEIISKDKSYVGCYADVDGNGTVDGVIYADLAVGGSGILEYEYESYSYSYNKETGLKDYYVSSTHNGVFGNGKEVLTATGEGKDRFYVMALADFSDSTYSYYASAESWNVEGDVYIMPKEFGKGNENSETMIDLWISSTFGVQNGNATKKDVWGEIRNVSKEGWFLPSYEELITFLGVFNINDDNYATKYYLSQAYLTSSSDYDPDVDFGSTCYYWGFEEGDHFWTVSPSDAIASVRLSITF